MIRKEEIFVNEKYWRSMSGDDLEQFIDKIFNYYRENGFPYHPTTTEYRNVEFNKLLNYDYRNIIKDDVVGQTMHGLGLAWSYFPHAYEVRSSKFMSPYEAFNDDKIFKEVIRKRLKIGTYMSDSGILKMLKIYSGVQGVSNFRPTAAAAIYDRYAKNGCVWDMSGGWGGRMLGAIISGVSEYVCNEPSVKTFNGLCELASDYGDNITYHIDISGSEEFTPPSKYFDLCFTSPPYFDLEKYSSDSGQSYIKFKTKQEWIDGFLYPTINNCYIGLKQGKNLLFNIADPKGSENINLVDKSIDIAKKIGFKYDGYLKLALSNVNMRDTTKSYKFEPILIFKKP